MCNINEDSTFLVCNTLSGRALPDSSEDGSSLIFRVKQSTFYLDCLTLKMKALFSFRTLGNTHPLTVSQPQRLGSSATLLQMPSIQLRCLVRHWHMHIHFEWEKKGNLYWIWMRKGLEMRQPRWLRNKYENNIPMKLRERECCDMKWTNVTWFTPTLAIINLLVPLPEFNV